MIRTQWGFIKLKKSRTTESPTKTNIHKFRVNSPNESQLAKILADLRYKICAIQGKGGNHKWSKNHMTWS